MSCVVGLVTKEGVILGSDSAASDGNIIIESTQRKLFTYDIESDSGLKTSLAIGVVGSIRTLSIFRFGLKPPIYSGLDEDYYVMQELIPMIEEQFKKSGIHSSDMRGGHDDSGSVMLVALRRKLYYIGEDFGAISNTNGYDAIGSAREVALGAMHASISLGLGGYDAITTALEAATALTLYVAKPYNYVAVPAH